MLVKVKGYESDYLSEDTEGKDIIINTDFIIEAVPHKVYSFYKDGKVNIRELVFYKIVMNNNSNWYINKLQFDDIMRNL